jgi:putative FmdB family regulatory protein
MPIYEYKCKQCNKVIEHNKLIETIKCPDCNEDCKNIISKNTFHLKGEGWFNSHEQK